MSKDDKTQDLDLFQQSISIDKKLKFDGIKPARIKLNPTIKNSNDTENDVVDNMFSEDFEPANLETGDELYFYRPGVSKADFRKLRKGQFIIQSELDLHGMTVSMAREELANFLHYCRKTGKRHVRIIHGKGRGSAQGQPVIKNKVNIWLQQRDEILAFCSARPADGGTGAIYVLIKKS
ncbi:MAG: Smr/MutS family protein [Gammaproteobacteria bacterium]